MSFFDSLGRLASEVEKAIRGEPELALKLKSCKACNFYQNGYCKQTSPPTKILSEYYAQGCIYYTVEEAVTGLLSKAEREAGIASVLDQIKKVDELTLLKTLENIDLVALITEVANISSVDLIDRITLIDAITDIGTVASVTSLGTLNLVNTISQITNIANVQNIDYIDNIRLIDSILAIGTLNSVGSIANIASVDLIDKITEVTEIKDIKTVGADNLFIDLIKQGAVGSRPIWETNYTATPVGYSNLNAVRGTIFPRGMRGIISKIRVHVKNTSGSAQDLKWSLKPSVGMGAIVSGTISIPNTTDAYVNLIDGYNETVKSLYWAYDQLVVEFEQNNQLYIGNKSTLYPSYVFYTGGYAQDNYLMIAVSIVGSPIGIVPIGGTVDTIQIPHSSGEHLYATVTATSTETTIKEIVGSGYTEYLMLRVATAPSSNLTIFRIYTDGNLAFEEAINTLNDRGYIASTPKISVLDFTVDDVCVVHLTIKFEFQRSLKITAENDVNDCGVLVEGLVNLIK